MDRMSLGVVVVRNHPFILSSCLSLEVTFLSWISVSGSSNAEGQREEPATRSVCIATRRAGWHPFAGLRPNEMILPEQSAEGPGVVSTPCAP